MNKDLTILLSSSVAALKSEALTLPIDIAKVRLQVQRNNKYTGMFHCIRTMVKEEGAASLWKGIAPALLRQVSYSALTMVLYENMYANLPAHIDKNGFSIKLLLGGVAGGTSIACFNWTEVIKTQLQTATTSNMTITSVTRKIYKEEGVSGFYQGLKPNVARTFIVNAVELGTYSQLKATLIPYLGDHSGTHLVSSFMAGVLSACASTPVDVLKTRMMNQAGGSNREYQGIISSFMHIVKHDGFGTLYSGFIPICARKAIWTSIFFVFYEKINSMAKAW